ncbi:NUDIX domain-containing protein [Xylophilus sp. GW821-FHT01B05]
MQLGDGTPRSPIASASVLLLRDAPAGIEVFLIERSGLSDVHGGAYVFPGGKLDRGDAAQAAALDGPADALHAALGEPDVDLLFAAALHAAGVRELQEETGVVLPASGLLPWSRWITPAASIRARKHFDVRFFVAQVPPGQSPVHDAHEASDSAWLRPAGALQDYWNGRIQLAPPQIMTLAELAQHADVASVLALARGRLPPRIQPEVFEEGGVHFVCYPGDERHAEPGRAMPGPTRLCWRQDRYEPPHGLQELLP